MRELGHAGIEAHGTRGTIPRGASVNYAEPSHVIRIIAGQSGTCANKSNNPGDAHRLSCTKTEFRCRSVPHVVSKSRGEDS